MRGERERGPTEMDDVILAARDSMDFGVMSGICDGLRMSRTRFGHILFDSTRFDLSRSGLGLPECLRLRLHVWGPHTIRLTMR